MQDKEKNKIDEIFRHGLAGLTEEVPSVAGWNSIKKEMANEGFKITAAKKYGKLLQISIASAILLTTGIASYLFIDKTNTTTESINSSLPKTEQELSIKTANEKIELKELNTHVNNAGNAINTNNSNVATDAQFASVETNMNSTSASVNTEKNKKTHIHSTTNSAQKNEDESAVILSEKNVSVTKNSRNTTNNIARKNTNNRPSSPSRNNAVTTIKNTVSKQNSDVKTTSIITDNAKITESVLSKENVTDNKQSTSDSNIAESKVELLANTTTDSKTDSDNSSTNKSNSTTVDSAATAGIPDTLNKTAEALTVILVDSTYKKFAVGIYLSCDRNNYAIQQVDNNLFGGTTDFGDAIKGNASWAQYTIGVTGGFKTSKRALIETGLFYSQKKKIDYNSNTFHTITSPDDTTAWADNKFSYHNNAQYIQLFLKIKMYFMDKEKYRLFVSPGFIFDANVPSSQKNDSYYQFESNTPNMYTKQKYTFEAGSIGTNLTISTGLELKMKNDWLIAFEPSYIYGLNQLVRYKNIESSLPVKHYNRSIGLGVRLIKEF